MDTRRALSFMMRSRMLNAEQFEEARQILRDIDSLDWHTAFLFDKINFLMDATVGFININQNKIIKIFSVASVALLPPTLIASIYGMNFQHMPELAGSAGATRCALALMAGVGGGAVHLLPAQGLAALAAACLCGSRAGAGALGSNREKSCCAAPPSEGGREGGGGEALRDFCREPAGCTAINTSGAPQSRPRGTRHHLRITSSDRCAIGDVIHGCAPSSVEL